MVFGGGVVMIKEMSEKRMNITDISKRMGISRPTIRKYLGEGKYFGQSREGKISIMSEY
jgi:DNA-binding transcriptional regulator LsrR (DeoR family)